MAFKKGHKKVGGRVKGTPNYTTQLIKEHLLRETGEYVNSGMLHEDICNIEDPSKRLDLFCKIVNYILPRQSSVDSTVNVTSEAQQSVLDRLSQLAKDNEE